MNKQLKRISSEISEACSLIGIVVSDKDIDTDLSGDIKQHYLEQASRYLFWASLEAKARNKRDKHKSKLDASEQHLKTVVKSELYSQCKTELELAGEKITEAKIEAAIYASKDYRTYLEEIHKLTEELDEINYAYFLIKSVADAFAMRKDMLMGLGAYVRLEVVSDNRRDEEE